MANPSRLSQSPRAISSPITIVLAPSPPPPMSSSIAALLLPLPNPHSARCLLLPQSWIAGVPHPEVRSPKSARGGARHCRARGRCALGGRWQAINEPRAPSSSELIKQGEGCWSSALDGDGGRDTSGGGAAREDRGGAASASSSTCYLAPWSSSSGAAPPPPRTALPSPAQWTTGCRQAARTRARCLGAATETDTEFDPSWVDL